MADQTHLIRSLGEYWSILPSRAETIYDLYSDLPDDYLSTVARLRAQRKTEEKEAKAQSKIATEKSTGDSRFANKVDANGVLTLNLRGEVVQSGSSFSDFFGSSDIALDDLDNLLAQAKTDSYVKALSVLMDSPGGIAIPSRNTAISIENFGKPVFAFISNMAASAGYDLISSATKIYASDSHISGSIGTMTALINRSGQDKQRGVERIMFASGEHKLTGVPGKDGEIPQEHLDRTQAFVNKLGGDFVESVAKRRNLSNAQKTDVAKAGIYVGEESVKAGLVDKIASLENYRKDVAAYMSGKKTIPSSKGKNKMSVETEDNLVSDPVELNDIPEAEDAIKIKAEDVEKKIENNSEMLSFLAENSIDSVDKLKNMISFAKIGEGARSSLEDTVKKYYALAEGEDCKDDFSDLSYDRLMQLGSSYRKVAISKNMIEVPKRESADDAANVEDSAKKSAPVGAEKLPMSELILAQKNRLLGITTNGGTK